MSRRIKTFPEKSQTFKTPWLAEKSRTPKHKAQENYRKYRETNPGRKCQICDKDPYPNYYFCPKCHGHTEFYSDLADED